MIAAPTPGPLDTDFPAAIAGVIELSLRIGQHVRHRDHQGKRVTGIVRGLSIEEERGLVATVLLDAPIVIPPVSEGDREIRIYWQTVDAHELAPFDDRDELIGVLLAALNIARDCIVTDRTAVADCHMHPETNAVDADGQAALDEYDAALEKIDAAIAKGAGRAS